MERQSSDRNILDEFCEDFCRIVEGHCKYIIVSGFLAIASGRTRGTEDIDMIVERLNLANFTSLFADLLESGFSCIQSQNPETAFEYLEDNTSIRFTRKDEHLPEMEVKFSKDILDEHQLETRVKIPLTGLDVWFSTVETNIAFKEELLKSPKDLEDAKHLRIVFAEEIKEEKVTGIKQLIGRLRL